MAKRSFFGDLQSGKSGASRECFPFDQRLNLNAFLASFLGLLIIDITNVVELLPRSPHKHTRSNTMNIPMTAHAKFPKTRGARTAAILGSTGFSALC